MSPVPASDYLAQLAAAESQIKEHLASIAQDAQRHGLKLVQTGPDSYELQPAHPGIDFAAAVKRMKNEALIRS